MTVSESPVWGHVDQWRHPRPPLGLWWPSGAQSLVRLGGFSPSILGTTVVHIPDAGRRGPVAGPGARPAPPPSRAGEWSGTV